MPLTRTDRNLWSAFIDEAKIVHLYLAYARKADEEGLHDIARVFREVAEAETEHAVNHLKVTGDVRSTVENLLTVTQGEVDEIDMVYPRMIREAEEEQRPDAVATFRYALEEEREHLSRLQQVLDRLLEQHPELRAVAGRVNDSTPGALAAPDGVPRAVRESAASEVSGERERISTLTRLREVIFGVQDGLVSTVAVTSSMAAATADNGIVIIAGATAGVAGMVSMAAGSYLGSRAEEEVQIAELEMEAREIAQKPAEELAELIEIYRREGLSDQEAAALAERIASDQELWLKTMAEKELGLSAEPLVSPWKDSLTMGVSFIIGAAVPLSLYLFLPAPAAVLPSIGLTLAALFLAGVGKGRVLGRQPLRSGLEVVAVGTVSAVIGYLIGNVLPGLLGVQPPAG